MELQHIPIEQLEVSKLNMRHGRKQPDIADILPSVRAHGVLQPLLVRPAKTDGHYEIVAGRRRFFAARAVADEAGGIEALPCAVMAAGDDAEALEASLIENFARLAPDEMTQYETFVRLGKNGRSVAEIAAMFAITERMVERRLALGNLVPRIRTAYREDRIDAATVRLLTMASAAQQKAWMALLDDPEQMEPRGHQLRQWLFGGQSIPVEVALFDLDDYPGEIVTDLFGEERFFADAALFWEHQNRAIAEKRNALIEAGWADVVVLEPGDYFRNWEHEVVAKEDGGKVFIAVSRRGDVECHEGYLGRREAARRARAAMVGEDAEGATDTEAARRPEATQAMQNYIDLHRHAAVRAELLQRPDVALRLIVAHMIASSGHWLVRPEPQACRGEAIAASIAGSRAQQAFESERKAVLELLGRDPAADRDVVRPGHDGYGTAEVFAHLLELGEAELLRIAAFAMAEALAAGSAMVEAAGNHLAVDMKKHWSADSVFVDMLRDRAVVDAMLADIAGERVAEANRSEKLKTRKAIIGDFAEGTNGRAKAEGWLPGWLAFPVRTVTETGRLQTADLWARVGHLFETTDET
ncbi:MAG: chromosome partitioning protein ParB [Rhizobiales bacterium NRL2]|jgi:ParB family chromosome partitioning protein|nr:MAG: chromosome partitioning protein ParB [Rhizobiales bacterium NRL2]ANK81535.1 MAG: chromosome partitioning protein ParB [Rhizobiales bacterium NRL2]